MFARKLTVFIAIICISLLCFLPSVLAAGEPSENVVINILTVNDFHGALSESGKNPGMAKLAAFLKAEVAKNPTGTIIVSAGDMFQGTPESNMLYGKPVVEAMNEIGFSAMAIGNHEFDWGTQVLRKRIAQSSFPYLAANIIDKATDQVVSFVKPYTIVEKNGLKIAIIGLATPETAYKTSPKYIKNYIFADPAQTVTQHIPELKQQGADIIIVLSHLGSEVDPLTGQIIGEAADLAHAVTAIDAIISGHTHQKVSGAVNSVPIVQAAYNGRAVGNLSLTFSKMDRKVVAAESNITEVAAANLVADPEVKAIVDKVQEEVAPMKNKVLGHTVYELKHEKYSHSVLGQWVTDSMRQKVKADIAFENGGGLRASIPAGAITLGTLYQVVPFDNTLVTVELTGKQILEVLEHGIDNQQIGMVQFSGLKVEYDKLLPAGKRITKVTLTDGSKLILTKIYKVATNDFLAQGGDGFTMFSQGKHLIDTQLPLRDCLIEAVMKTKVINATVDKRFIEIMPVNTVHRAAA
ncbi:Endonuclease YhcR precursor [Sporomusa ovata DSM 2662]|uniref:5'-nucleotidase n=1 Tax=Sporomusa ovata TaxID=2378 RepID=A0A0U1KZ78_9FIRM|nr:5'-nucleotidase C-terminal domain-containing protein [Sporomusa ovata]EQB29154.1 5'-nucleotidase domain-containing protein [Sporomusa ovata DSM 2662]CQR72585.1 5'-nucleotidase [Sporomusa ovata]